ncbi:HET-domain-containing protein [Lentinus tigrinus ALCF2SS1-7]|uniref:HET-domain-containing protein n=1 Tax=Lentinus tigrinus ALCF2SS1-6 TaxID=1328759 RepID=A0A5C2RS54_9APHY|nr:HET-domain-containing protein [Lentinus tigrinus ALCF2SS1-6]RPD68474.1 HET-domain-containing protein [Lentinus tigrinus ALCF2SS1-7]
MRLLNTQTFVVKEFNDESDLPPYAILSHVWGKPEDEVTFADMQDLKQARKRAGWIKVEQFCAFARQNDLDWAWDDTCCIDKSSSAELSQAINSMYAWYSEARVCYAYLLDVEDPGRANPTAEDSSFRGSRWFKRGWTLQELIAPKVVLLYSKNWRPLGSKASLAAAIEEITNIDSAVLMHERLLDDVSIARRMSWASARQTTKLEDRAYSLMGIFGVNMPAIYGEGDRAFIRLQQEIIHQSPDQSIFAWGNPYEYQVFLDNATVLTDQPGWATDYRCLLASSPDRFADSANIEPFPVEQLTKYTHSGISSDVPEYTPTNYGIQIHLPLYLIPNSSIGLALLACKDAASGHVVSLLVGRMRNSSNRFYVGMYTQATWPMKQFGWHPIMRMFLLHPQSSAAGVRILQNVTLTRMYLQSHNANPQRSREQGLAGGELILHRPVDGRVEAQPKRFAFFIHGWLLRALEKIKFNVVGWGVSGAKLVGWTPRMFWRQDDKLGLTLTLYNPASLDTPNSKDGQSSQSANVAAILFRRPSTNANEAGDAFALIFGVTSLEETCSDPSRDRVAETSKVWSTVAIVQPDARVDGKSDAHIGHDLVRSLLSCFAKTTNSEVRSQGYDVASWKEGTYEYRTVERMVKVTLTRWLTRDEDVWLDKHATMRYTVGLEVDFGSGAQLRASTEKEKVASLSGLSAIVVR